MLIVNRDQLSVSGSGAMESRQTVEIRVRRHVEGVGFGSTVCGLACDEGLVGEVLNDGFGVLIRTTGNCGAISQFLTRLHTEAPPLSQIEGVETQVLSLLDYEDFRIAESISGENCTRVTADAAICQACRARSEEHTSELQSRSDLVCRLLLEKKKKTE